MEALRHPSAVDWLAVCREAGRRGAQVLADNPTVAERAVEAGRGESGDRSLRIDLAAEEAVFSLLDGLAAEGHGFTAVSEERGEVDYGDRDTLVVIDPIDGSLNAKRGLSPHALSMAVSDGPTMADVLFAYVLDFGAGEEWVAERGRGARLNGGPLDASLGERRNRAGRLEVVGIESADPRWIAESVEGLMRTTHRVRALGSIAVTLCHVAAARLDAMLSLRRCRGFDAAAGQLIVREAGGLVSFPRCAAPLAAPLDLVAHSPIVAARSVRALDELASVPSV